MIQNKKQLCVIIHLALTLNGFSQFFDINDPLEAVNLKNVKISTSQPVWKSFKKLIINYSVYDQASDSQKYKLEKKIGIDTSPDSHEIYNTIDKLFKKNLIYSNFFKVTVSPFDSNDFFDPKYSDYCLIVGYTKQPLSASDFPSVTKYEELSDQTDRNFNGILRAIGAPLILNRPISQETDISLFKKEINIHCPKNQFDRCYFRFPTVWKLKAELKLIHTQDGVKLTNNDKEVDLTKALRSYFVPKLWDLDHQKFAQEFINRYQHSYSEPLSEKEIKHVLNLRNYGRKSLTKQNYDLLKHSTVIAVWAVKCHPNKTNPSKNMKSEIVGLLKHDQTNQLSYFHYDLEQDLSVLMNYKPRE